MTDYEYDIPDTPFWAEIRLEDEAGNEWSWTVWTTDPDDDDALVEVDSGTSSGETAAKLDFATAAKFAFKSWVHREG